MEPSYVGANGRIDAMAAAWLLDNDHVFFQEDEISWDGANHSIVGAQINLANADQAPVFKENYQMLIGGVVDLMTALEGDEGLRVSRSDIAPALRSALREGDLTGITLFNLIACGHAIKIDRGEGDSCRVIHDMRLSRGIPAFYKLVARMIWDMRAYNGVEAPFQVAFVAARNIDADQYLEDFDGVVPGAISESMWVEEVAGAPDVPGAVAADEDAVSPDGLASAVEGEEAAVDDDEERKAAIAVMRLFVLTSGLGGATIPQELVDELDRAENGDTSVDLEDLMRRMNDATPKVQAADLSNVTYDNGERVRGRRFSVALPDGWTALKDYEESMLFTTQVRPFVLVQGEATNEDDVSFSDRIIYSALGGDVEMGEGADCGIDAMLWALKFYTAYDRSDESLAAKPVIVWDEEVQALNVKCLVTQHVPNGGTNGVEFAVMPYALDHADFLRVVLSYEEGVTDLDVLRNVVKEFAATLELDKPIEPTCETTLKKALSGKVSATEFVKMTENFAKPYFGLRQMVFTASQYKYAGAVANYDDNDCTLAGARGIAQLDSSAEAVFARMLDAYDKQVECGASEGDRKKMLTALEQFSDQAFPTYDMFDGASAKLLEKAAVFEPSAELVSVQNHLKNAKCVQNAAIEEKKRKAEEKRKLKAEEERLAKERKAEEEKLAKESKAKELEEAKKLVLEIETKLAPIREALEAAEKPTKTPSERKVASLNMKIGKLEKELENQGLFAFSKKKELRAEIEKLQAEKKNNEANIPAEKSADAAATKEAVAKLTGEIKRLESEAKPYWDIVLAEELKVFAGRKAGDFVQFGRYPQSSEKARPEPISWQILDDDNGELLMISVRVLDYRPFNLVEGKKNSYAGSDLRAWIEGEFVESAFSCNEQKLISGKPYIPDSSMMANYFKKKEDRRSAASEFARAKGAKDYSGNTFYWLSDSFRDTGFWCINPHGHILGTDKTIYDMGTSFGSVGIDAHYPSGVRLAIKIKAD